MTHHEKAPEPALAADILVIGAGGGGLLAAIEAIERGANGIISKRRKADAHTSLAAGGINAALATLD